MGYFREVLSSQTVYSGGGGVGDGDERLVARLRTSIFIDQREELLAEQCQYRCKRQSLWFRVCDINVFIYQ